ncbi:MAG: hypothetical protein J6P30_00875 [Fibrobacter sp.]|nr:hypothetical protein [Fibrobacter sp.]
MNKRILFTAVSLFVVIEMLVADCVAFGWGVCLFTFLGMTFVTAIWIAVSKGIINKLKQPFFMPELQKISCRPGFFTEYVLYYVLIIYAVMLVLFSALCIFRDGDLLKTLADVTMAAAWIEGLVVIACVKAVRRWKKTGDKRELLFPWPVK